MKYKLLNKKTLLSSLVMTAIVATPLATVVSCGTKQTAYSSTWSKSSRHDVVVSLTSEDGKQPYVGKDFQFAPTTIGATTTVFSEGFNSYTTLGLRPTLNGKPVYDVTGQMIGGAETKLSLKFEVFNKITLITQDGTEIVFDSDKDQSQGTVPDNSINSPKFIEAINGQQIVEIKFDITDGNWVQNRTGQKTSHKFKSGDVLKGIAHNRYQSSASRHGGTDPSPVESALGKFTNDKYKTSFSDPTGQTARSGWDGGHGITYGIDTTRTLSQGKDANTFSFYFKNNTERRKIASFWNINFSRLGGYYILPQSQYEPVAEIPSDLIDFVQGRISPAGGPLLSRDEVIAKINESDAWREGFYTYYTYDWNQYITGGQYFVKDVADRYVSFSRNQHYTNEEFTSRTDTVNNFTYEMVATKSGVSDITIFDGYKQGNYVSAAQSNVPAGELGKVNSNPEGYGKTYIKGRTTSSQVQSRWTKFNFIPNFANDGDAKQVFFNDAFAKVMYGKDLRTLRNEQKANQKSYDWVEHAVAGTGVQFRSSIYSVINWLAATDHRNNTQEWLSNVAPEQTLPKSGNVTTTPIESEKIYSSYAVNAGATHSLTQITHKERQDSIYNTNTQNNKYYAGSVEDIAAAKANIKKALDDANIMEGEKVTFELSIDYSSYPKKVREALDSIRTAINGLDDRLNVVAAMIPVNLTDPNSDTTAANAILDSNGEVIDWRQSYLPQEEFWSFVGRDENEAKKDSYNATHIFPRLSTGMGGIGAFSLNSQVQNFEADTPTIPLLANAGHIQQGGILALAYYALNQAKLPQQFGKFSDFAKSYFEKLAEAFPKDLTDSMANGGYTFTTDVQAAILGVFNNFDANAVINSSMNSINHLDYLGFGDQMPNSAYTHLQSEMKKLPDVEYKKAYSLYSTIWNDALKNAEFEMREVTKDYTLADWEQVIPAYDTYVGNSWTFWSLAIGNRGFLGFALTKNWYEISHYNQVSYIGSARIKS